MHKDSNDLLRHALAHGGPSLRASTAFPFQPLNFLLFSLISPSLDTLRLSTYHGSPPSPLQASSGWRLYWYVRSCSRPPRLWRVEGGRRDGENRPTVRGARGSFRDSTKPTRYVPRPLSNLPSPSLYSHLHFLADDADPPPVYVEADGAGRDCQGCATPAGFGPPAVGFFLGLAATVVHPASAMFQNKTITCTPVRVRGV